MFEIIKLDDCPLALMRASGTPSDRELTETLQRITKFLEDQSRARRRVLMIIDMSQATALRAGQRRIASEWMKHNNQHYKPVALASALIISSALVRGVLTALLWVTPIDMPYEVFGNVDDAVRWAITRFESENVQVPDRLRRELGHVFTTPPTAAVASR